jgi:hypothetical protein
MPVMVCGAVPVSALAELIPEKRVPYAPWVSLDAIVSYANNLVRF